MKEKQKVIAGYRSRYHNAKRKEKATILNEVLFITGCTPCASSTSIFFKWCRKAFPPINRYPIIAYPKPFYPPPQPFRRFYVPFPPYREPAVRCRDFTTFPMILTLIFRMPIPRQTGGITD
ncbi:MAG: hypothetical protein LBU28_06265 [Spirochaetaceae bacterium]|jgi:hypothetical protein|nr:hypothetical protein [Spirochaetaceae bacterium]